MPKKLHYINNKEFYSHMIEYNKLVKESEAVGEDPPAVSEYIARCFWEIAMGLAKKPNFINYTYKDEMIMDGVENCIRYCHNFDPEKSKNPFSYFTQIIYYAFLRRIEKEKKQTYVKFKMTENYGNFDDLVTMSGDFKLDIKVYDNFRDVIDEFEQKMENKKKSMSKPENTKSKEYALDKFMEWFCDSKNIYIDN